MPLSNANIRALNSYVKSLKRHNSYFIAHTCLCILFLPELWKRCTKLTQPFLFNLLLHSYSTDTLYLQFADEYGRTKRKRKNGLLYLSLFLYALFSA